MDFLQFLLEALTPMTWVMVLILLVGMLWTYR